MDLVRETARRFRGTKQLQPDFLWGVVPFLPVAFSTTGHDVFPGLAPAAGYRDYVIISQISWSKASATILTAMLIPGVNVGAGEFYLVMAVLDVDILEQPEN